MPIYIYPDGTVDQPANPFFISGTATIDASGHGSIELLYSDGTMLTTFQMAPSRQTMSGQATSHGGTFPFTGVKE